VSWTRRGFAALVAAAALAAPEPVHAHGRSTSIAAWEISSGPPASARVHLRVAWADLQRALPALGGVTPAGLAARPALAQAVDAYLVERYALVADGRACAVDGRVAALPTSDPGHVARRWRVVCPDAGDLRLRGAGFFEALAGHLHLARIRRDDAPPVEQVFLLDRREIALDETAGAAPTPAGGIATFIGLGVQHIATGYDHLAFLLALLLLGGSILEVATIVTGFTLAHSVTLALGVLGWVRPEAAAVEALIGLSIAVVALENASLVGGPRLRRGVWIALAALFAVGTAGAAFGRVSVPAAALAGVGLFSLCYLGLSARVARPFRLRWLVAFVFGLIHGFGFAGVLVEMALPPERLAPALLGFNVGVELGQLAIVALAWPLLRFLLSREWLPRSLVVQAGSAAVLAAGLFWFVSRALA
jgi:hypothetical protein